MPSVHPVLCFSDYLDAEKLLSFAQSQGEKWRSKFQKKIDDVERLCLIEQRELFQRKGVCALFNGVNLKVAHFSESLVEVLTEMDGFTDFAGFQRIHDQISPRILPEGAEPGLQLPQFWMLLIDLMNKGFLQKDQPDLVQDWQKEWQQNRFTSLIILPTLDCTYRCDYCYHKGIAETVKQSSELTIDQAKRGIDCLIANTADDEVERAVRFTGGEPMMHYDLIKGAIDYVDQLKDNKPTLGPFTFSMVTNGSLIDDKWIELIKKHQIAMAVSLDGRKATNDKRRKSLKGSAYEKTTAGLRKLGEAGIRPVVFFTVSANNIDSLFEDVAWLYENFDLGGFSLNLDTSSVGLRDYEVPPEQYTDALIKTYEALSEKGVFDSKALLSYTRFKSKEITISGCGAVFSHMVLLPDGTIGPCPRCIDSTERMEIGDGLDLNDSRLFKRWAGYSHTLNKTCQACHFFNICEGWCPEASFQFNGRHWEPNDYACLFTKRLTEWIIWSDFQKEASKLFEGQE